MTITLGAFSTGTNLHGTLQVPQWEFSRVSQSWFAVVGEQNLFGRSHFRYFGTWVQLTGYVSHVALQAQIATWASQLAENGTLTIDLGGGDIAQYTKCIFEGFEPEEEPWLDGSGQNGWQCRGKIKIRQVAT